MTFSLTCAGESAISNVVAGGWALGALGGRTRQGLLWSESNGEMNTAIEQVLKMKISGAKDKGYMARKQGWMCKGAAAKIW